MPFNFHFLILFCKILNHFLPITIIIIILIINLVMTTTTTTTPVTTYIGDRSIDEYLQQIDCGKRLPSKYSLIIFLVGDSPNQSTTTNKSLRDQKCEPLLLSCNLANNSSKCDEHISTQIETMINDPIFEYKNLIILFRFDSQNRATISRNISAFDRFALRLLPPLYLQCYHCEAFLFDISPLAIDHLYRSLKALKWNQSDDDNKLNNFRAIFASYSSPTKKSKTIHLNPILDGCLQFVGPFSPRGNKDFARLRSSLSPHDCDLNQTEITVSLRMFPAVCEFRLDPKTGKLAPSTDGAETRLLMLLAEKFRFNYRILLSEKEFPMEEVSEQIEYVMNGEATLAMCLLMYIPEIFEGENRVRLSRFLVTDNIAFLSRANRLANRYWIVFQPYSSLVWIIYGGLFVALFAIFWAGMRARSSISSISTESSPASPVTVATRLFAIILCQSTNVWTERHTTSRLKYAVWMFATLFMSQMYNSIFYSIIAVPRYEPPIDTVDDLLDAIRHDTFKLILPSSLESLQLLFQTATPDMRELYEIGQHQIRTGLPPLTSEYDMIPTLERDSHRIVLSSSLIATVLQHTTSMPTHLSSGFVLQIFTTVPIQSRSPLLRPIDFFIQKMKENGIIDFWIACSSKAQMDLEKPAGGTQQQSSKTTIKSFLISDLYSIFILWLVGVVFSGAVFLLELSVYYFCHFMIDRNETIGLGAKRHRVNRIARNGSTFSKPYETTSIRTDKRYRENRSNLSWSLSCCNIS